MWEIASVENLVEWKVSQMVELLGLVGVERLVDKMVDEMDHMMAVWMDYSSVDGMAGYLVEYSVEYLDNN